MSSSKYKLTDLPHNDSWHDIKIDRKLLRELATRKNGPALRDMGIWLALLALAGTGGWYFWGSLWAVPCFIVYGVLYGSSASAREHETMHKTAFKTPWLNSLFYHITCFMLMREPMVRHYAHTRHHRETIITNRDPEIVTHNPPNFIEFALNIFALLHFFRAGKSILRHAMGQLNDEQKTYIPKHSYPRLFLTARIWLSIYIAMIALTLYQQSILPLMYVGLPTIYGSWLLIFFTATQHVGLAENVHDHRLNTRTIYMNRILRWHYLNMNYHLEHHLFPIVPYHALPQLHEAIKDQCPPAYDGIMSAWKELWPVLIEQHQGKNESGDIYIRRMLPDFD